MLESLTLDVVLFFSQAVPLADPAHFLRRSCHGSALCHHWLKMEETFSFSLYQTLKLSSEGKSCSPPNPSYLHSLTEKLILMKRSNLFDSSSCHTKTNIWQKNGTLWMNEWKEDLLTGHFCGHLSVPDLNWEGSQKVCIHSVTKLS